MAKYISEISSEDITDIGDDIYNTIKLQPLQEVDVSIRLLMPGKDVGSIIGKAGIHIKNVRDMSGAKINISDNTTAERLVTISGTPSSILKAVLLMTIKLEKDSAAVPSASSSYGITPVILNLPFPTVQCGCFIGKSGANIKDIRDTTTASIQVAGECLPLSSERVITIQGHPNATTQVVYSICSVLIDHPLKFDVDLYQPERGQISHGPPSPWSGPHNTYKDIGGYRTHPHMYGPYNSNGRHGGPRSAVRGRSFPNFRPDFAFQDRVPDVNYHDRIANVARVYKQHGDPDNSHVMYIPNDLIGCIIGKGGQKINEIRSISGATIKISDPGKDVKADRVVTISGPLESIGLAQYHINCRLQENSRGSNFEN